MEHQRHALRRPDRASRARGSMLIIAIGVLTLLAVLGTTFVSLMKLERQATKNYLDAQVIELVNHSALERVIAELRGASNHFSYTRVRSPWLYEYKDRSGNNIPGEFAHGRTDIEDPRVGNWDILMDDQKRLYRYKTKVIDCSAQININGRQDSLPRMIESLARAIVSSSRLNKSSQDPLYTGPNQSGQRLKGLHIIEFRNKLEGHKFRSKTQLRELIGRENYETIKDFITVHSWEDPYTGVPSDGLNEVDELQVSRGGGGRSLGGGGQTTQHLPVHRISPPLGLEPRSPVNVNTAPEEVLVACLMGVGGRRAFPYSRLQYTAIDEGAAIMGSKPVGSEERLDLLPRGVWIFMQPLRYEQAIKLARRIIEQRKNPARQFRTWSSGTSAQPGFAEFINSLDESFFPNPSTAQGIDPAAPDNRRSVNEIIRGGNEINRMWIKGHDTRERSVRVEAGLPFHRQNAFYYELCKAALISNFNPNSRINRYNPNAPAYTPVDKSDLVILDEQDGRTPRKGYTTEFCFDTMGIYEVTTLGELAQRSGPEQFESLLRQKLRTVVQVFDVLRHTTQFHFETTFSNKFSYSSRANRRNVVTWPEPMEALTPAVTRGSRLDGRIELAGMKDGLRMQMNPAARPQSYRTSEAIIMAHGFQDRDDQSYAQLKRLVRGNAVGRSDEYNKTLADVLDVPYHKSNSQFTKMYRREELLAMGLTGSGSTASINNDAAVGTSEEGSDLRPDGLHTSLFTTGHLGGRFLLLPSHQRLGQGSKGGRGTQVGAGQRTNLTGNVPYYDGGLAFWVKFEFDGDDPVFSGLVGCTSVIEAVGQSPPKDTEGTQFYIFKNTKGQLRIVRMYYHQAFPPAGGGDAAGGGGDGATGLNLWPPVEIDEGGSAEDNDVLDLDPRKPIARADILVPIGHFRAHEWHHIAVDWNDSAPGQALQVWIDFERIQGGGPFIPQETIEDEPNAWVRLNCRDPKDGLFIGGFIRQQGVADAGVFKWYTNSLGGGETNTRGIQVVEPTTKRVLANATIDEFITYNGTFQGVRSYFVPRGAPGYFTNQTGEYANLMEVPLPPGVDHVVLRSFDWTAYTPTFFTGNDNFPRKLMTDPGIQVQVLINSPRSPGTFRAPWEDPSVRNKVAGHTASRRRGSKPGSNADLVYRFTIPPGRAQGGSLAGGSVQTPAIDDVTLTYFLAAPRILHQEEEE